MQGSVQSEEDKKEGDDGGEGYDGRSEIQERDSW